MDGDFIDGDWVGDVTSVGCNFLTELLDLMEFFVMLITGAIRWSKLFQQAAQTQETGKEELCAQYIPMQLHLMENMVANMMRFSVFMVYFLVA